MNRVQYLSDTLLRFRFSGIVVQIPFIISICIRLIKEFIFISYFRLRLWLRFRRHFFRLRLFRRLHRNHIAECYQVGTNITGFFRPVRSRKRNIIPGFIAAVCLSADNNLMAFRYGVHYAFACGSRRPDFGRTHFNRRILCIHRRFRTGLGSRCKTGIICLRPVRLSVIGTAFFFNQVRTGITNRVGVYLNFIPDSSRGIRHFFVNRHHGSL